MSILSRSGQEGGINGDFSGANEGISPYPNSQHPGGINVLMADGACRFVNDSLDGRVWARLVSPNGTKMVNPTTGVLGGDAMEKDPPQASLGGFLGWTQLPVNQNY